MKKYLKDFIVFFIILIINCIVTIKLNNLPDWDFYSYHFNNGWAFWHNRLDIDFLPNLFRSYFNPLLDGLIYFGIERLNHHPLIFLLISGLKYGILMFISFKLYELLFDNLDKFNKYIGVIFSLILACSSPIILFCLSFDNTDIQCANLVLIGLYLFLKSIFKNSSKSRYYLIFFAMVFEGMALGLKYVNIIYIVSFLLTTLCLIKFIQKPVKTICFEILGIFTGFMCTGGWWFFTIWHKFKNPFFPYFNDIFKSPFANSESILNMDYLHLKANTIWEFIFYPLRNTAEKAFIGFEQKYYDLKIALSFILIVCIITMLLNKSIREKISNIINLKILYFILIFMITTYYTNNFLFTNIRYLIPLFVLAPAIYYLFVVSTVKKEYYVYPLIIITGLYFVTYKGYSGLGQYPYKNEQEIIRPIPLKIEDDAVVICANFSACAAAPFQNTKVKYIGYSLPKRLVKYGFWIDKDFYKNQYYINEYLQKKLIKTFAENNNIYFLYSESNMGPDLIDLELYKTALFIYTKGALSLENCHQFHYTILNHDIIDQHHICKIKSKVSE